MVWSTMHWQRLVNGFAGAETALVQRFRATAGSFPEARALDVMKEAGTKYVVVHLRGLGPNQRERLESRVAEMKDRLREVARFANPERSDFDFDVVYELLGP
jgi:sugar phosphate isomerase/epimerase